MKILRRFILGHPFVLTVKVSSHLSWKLSLICIQNYGRQLTMVCELGDVCRGDTVLFKQKVHEKSGKRHSKCMGKRIVAGKVVKESYGKDKQQHTFTIQVFWSKGVGKLPPLYLLLVKGRNLYRMMTFRQAWANEANRLKALEEKHNRGDAARRVRASNRRNSGGHALKGKKSKEKGKHQSQPGGPDGGSNITKGRKRAMQSSNSDHPTKKNRKEEHRVSSGKNRTDGRQKAKTNSAPLDKNIGTSTSSSQQNANTETNHAISQKNPRTAPVNNGLHSTEARPSKGKTGSKQKNTVGGNHGQFEGRRVGSASHPQAYPGNSVGIHHPLSERTHRPPPLREVGNAWQHHMDGRSISCPNPTMVFEHPNAALAGWRAPGYFREPPPDQRAVVFPPFNTSQTMYRRHPDGAYVMPQYRYSGVKLLLALPRRTASATSAGFSPPKITNVPPVVPKKKLGDDKEPPGPSFASNHTNGVRVATASPANGTPHLPEKNGLESRRRRRGGAPRRPPKDEEDCGGASCGNSGCLYGNCSNVGGGRSRQQKNAVVKCSMKCQQVFEVGVIRTQKSSQFYFYSTKHLGDRLGAVKIFLQCLNMNLGRKSYGDMQRCMSADPCPPGAVAESPVQCACVLCSADQRPTVAPARTYYVLHEVNVFDSDQPSALPGWFGTTGLRTLKKKSTLYDNDRPLGSGFACTLPLPCHAPPQAKRPSHDRVAKENPSHGKCSSGNSLMCLSLSSEAKARCLCRLSTQQ
ncbi:hypothetical protein TRIUR3_22403 [Triticum urartu]|uniref:DUF7699 domain-containing protein n=1 Tax=Triticum urartu TaxID=4572 RepID=M7ZFT3_TRIUA|nr:hypothetical protein TRIUR3_22403 [Triticum urartu]